ncbi:MAG: hypothetical protein DME09_02385 [Candidatus Rokuibacteriota bacterium]|nr:MAG: hypothetical protein DME09_02385 [Candidatus Rokubacteria bacterium]
MGPAHRDRDQFLQLIARLHAVAERHGDRAFAGALGDCLIDASGGEPKCPMAELFLQEYAETGHPPRLEGERTRPLRPMGIDEPPPYDRQPLLEKIHHALEERAILKGDTRYVQALHVCHRAMEENDSCPMHRLLKQQPM